MVHDHATSTAPPSRTPRDWYAQDADGNIWYLGEQTAEYENGQLTSTEGSWEAGVDGAQPGIALPAEPRPGLEYRQEYLKGQAEDAAPRCCRPTSRRRCPPATYTGALMTRETTPLEPDPIELKFYAPGIGPVMTAPDLRWSSRSSWCETTGAAERRQRRAAAMLPRTGRPSSSSIWARW